MYSMLYICSPLRRGLLKKYQEKSNGVQRRRGRHPKNGRKKRTESLELVSARVDPDHRPTGRSLGPQCRSKSAVSLRNAAKTDSMSFAAMFWLR
jgi:hypothetical protein